MCFSHELLEMSTPYFQALFHVFECRETARCTSVHQTLGASIAKGELLHVFPQRHDWDNNVRSFDTTVL